MVGFLRDCVVGWWSPDVGVPIPRLNYIILDIIY